ncbi:MAG: MMPL family transporter [Deltaproteobacteria bacterium]|nr:MMPL family transporter [Deltaproteobacteria bacterium]
MDRILLACGNFAVDQKWRVTIVAIVLVFVAGIGISQLRPSHDVLYWFKKGTEIRDNTDLIDSKMKGTLAIEVVIDTGVENGLFEPVVLNGLEKLAERLMAYKGEDPSMFVGKTISLVDMLKEINQALHENQIEHYAIPQDRQLIAQEFLLFENSGSDDLEDIVDSRFSKTHLTAKVPWNDSVNYVHFVNYVESNVEEIFGDKYETAVTGLIQMMMKTVSAMMHSTFKSYGIAVVIITILMILLLGRFRIGVLSMIPNLFPIILILGLMGWTGIKLDMFTMLIGSIAIGLAVDDTIHFFHNFRIFYEESGNVRNAVLETLTTAGRAMLVTTVVLAIGFWLFMFASMNHLFNFGLLTGTTLVFAFLADILLAPALLAIVTPDKKHLPLLIPDKKNKIGSN